MVVLGLFNLILQNGNHCHSLDLSLLVTTDEEETVSYWVAYKAVVGTRVTGVVNGTYTM